MTNYLRNASKIPFIILGLLVTGILIFSTTATLDIVYVISNVIKNK